MPAEVDRTLGRPRSNLSPCVELVNLNLPNNPREGVLPLLFYVKEQRPREVKEFAQSYTAGFQSQMPSVLTVKLSACLPTYLFSCLPNTWNCACLGPSGHPLPVFYPVLTPTAMSLPKHLTPWLPLSCPNSMPSVKAKFKSYFVHKAISYYSWVY